MKKTAAALMISAALTGCATTTALTNKDVSPPLDYTDASGKRHFVTGEVHHLANGNSFEGYTRAYQLQVSIDGELFLDGPLSKEGFNGTVAGKYADKSAVASCIGTPRSSTWTDVRCEVAIDGQRIGALTF